MAVPKTLGGIRVVAVEQAVAGPICSRYLAEFGAEVIKIEPPSGDMARAYDRVAGGWSSHFVWLNAGKQSHVVDRREAGDVEGLYELIGCSDVLLSNIRPGALERLVDVRRVREVNPGLITCMIDGYGEGGPYSERSALDLLVQGESGVTASTGTPGHPAKCGVSIADLGAGTYALAGILNALYHRERTGEAASVHIAMLDVMTEWIAPLLIAYEQTNEVPPPRGTNHASITPYGAFTTADGIVINIAVQTEEHWERLCRDVFGNEALGRDRRFVDNSARVEHRVALEEQIAGEVGRLSLAQISARLDSSGLPWGRLNDIPDVLAHPQLVARDRWRAVRLDGDSVQVRLPRSPFDEGGKKESGLEVPVLGPPVRLMQLGPLSQRSVV